MKLAILGCGNMAQALVGPMPLSDWDISSIAYDPIIEKAESLGDEFVNKISDLPASDLYLIACKPQQFDDLAKDLKVDSSATIISIMAGVSLKTIEEKLGVSSIVRVMPNTPALVGEGVNAVYFGPSVANNKVELIEKMFHSVSELFVFPKEESIDIITGFSGSGPAYIFEIARIMIDKMVSMGITRRSSTLMIQKTILGAARLMIESENSPEELRDMVTSKKGVTYEALEVFKESDLEGIFSKALDAAYKKTRKLSS